MSYLHNLAKDIQRLKPGEWLTVSALVMREIAPPMPLVGFGGPEWSPAEQIMENIVGSAYEFTFERDLRSGNVTFRRLAKPLTDGRRTYVSPDRRDWFERDGNGFWKRKTMNTDYMGRRGAPRHRMSGQGAGPTG